VHLVDASAARALDTHSVSAATRARSSERESIMVPTQDNDGRNCSEMDHSELVLAAKHDRRRREELVEAFRPLIANVARPYRRQGALDRDELMQQGVVGLLRALERYDPSLGTPFWAYASWWVRQAMQQVVSELVGPVVLSDRAQRALSRLNAARHAYLQEYRTEPTRTQLAAAANLDVSHVDSLMVARRRPRALEEPIGDTEGGCLGDLLADPQAEDEFECVPRRTAAEALPALLAQLNARERFVVCGRFGLDGEERTLREIAEDLGLSAERVRQIEHSALQTLRDLVASPAAELPTRDVSQEEGPRRAASTSIDATLISKRETTYVGAR
jgi:RNA polymerase primary sigma factor